MGLHEFLRKRVALRGVARIGGRSHADSASFEKRLGVWRFPPQVTRQRAASRPHQIRPSDGSASSRASQQLNAVVSEQLCGSIRIAVGLDVQREHALIRIDFAAVDTNTLDCDAGGGQDLCRLMDTVQVHERSDGFPRHEY